VGFSVGLSARSQFWLSVLSGLCLCRDLVSVSVLFCASMFFNAGEMSDLHSFWFGGSPCLLGAWGDGPSDSGAQQRAGAHAPAHSTPELPIPAGV
jgi:hypothetical protein